MPMVVVIAGGVAAQRGLIKSRLTFELAYRMSHTVFDKAGTFTNREPTVEH